MVTNDIQTRTHRERDRFHCGCAGACAGVRAANPSETDIRADATPVSYTHLDVYKRQDLVRVVGRHVSRQTPAGAGGPVAVLIACIQCMSVAMGVTRAHIYVYMKFRVKYLRNI